LQNIFLMNNLLDMLQKVNGAEMLKTLLGDNWISGCCGQIRQYLTGYLRSSWARVLACLGDDALPQIKGSSSAHEAAVKDRFNNFNLAFKELYKTDKMEGCGSSVERRIEDFHHGKGSSCISIICWEIPGPARGRREFCNTYKIQS
jgi:hypothetical protein